MDSSTGGRPHEQGRPTLSRPQDVKRGRAGLANDEVRPGLGERAASDERRIRVTREGRRVRRVVRRAVQVDEPTGGQTGEGRREQGAREGLHRDVAARRILVDALATVLGCRDGPGVGDRRGGLVDRPGLRDGGVCRGTVDDAGDPSAGSSAGHEGESVGSV